MSTRKRAHKPADPEDAIQLSTKAKKRSTVAFGGKQSESEPSSSDKQFWLLKSEPDDFSIERMESERKAMWDGIRNAQARANLRKMQLGDRCLFYHSSCKQIGVAGEVSVVRTAYADPADAAWAVVDLEYIRTYPQFVGLDVLKAMAAEDLAGLALFKQPRLSVQPVSPEHFRAIVAVGTGTKTAE